MSSPEPRRIQAAVVGPDLSGRGGISTVANLWLGSTSWGACEVQYVPTMVDVGHPVRRVAHMAMQQSRFVGRLARGWRPDVLHVHLSYFTSFYRKLFYIEQARAVGIPVLVHVHAPDLGGFAEARRVHAEALKAVFHQVSRVVVLSEDMARLVHGITGEDTRTEVIYNPVRIADFGGKPRPADAPPTCLFMGMVGDRKGTFDLAEAVPRVLEQVPDARFVFGGNGEVERLNARLAELGVADRCDVLGWVSGEDKDRAFAEATVYCLPSYHEGLPMSILEAMAGGLPVVSTPVAGIPEAVEDGVTGYLTEPGDVDALADRLIRLLGDGAHASDLGAAAVARAQRLFDVDVVVGQVVDLWNTVLDEEG